MSITPRRRVPRFAGDDVERPGLTIGVGQPLERLLATGAVLDMVADRVLLDFAELIGQQPPELIRGRAGLEHRRLSAGGIAQSASGSDPSRRCDLLAKHPLHLALGLEDGGDLDPQPVGHGRAGHRLRWP